GAQARKSGFHRLCRAAHRHYPDRAVRRAEPWHREGRRVVRAGHGDLVHLDHGTIGLVTLGAVFLAVTGGEALYADLGHFGRKPIQIAWLCLVLPSLIINYFGQGAKVLADPAAIENPFYRLVPETFLLPMI